MKNDKKRLIFASNNRHKVSEVKTIFKDENIDIFSLKELDIHVDPVEDGETFEENAYIKAKAVYDYMKEANILYDEDIVIADDSGFCIDYLNGEPGIYSSRYRGEDTSYIEKFEYILGKMKDVKDEDRKCHFETCICMIYKNDIKYFHGRLDGNVSKEVLGDNGFGYDPIFFLDEYKDTVASIGQDIKNKISHRRKALDNLYEYIKNNL